MKFYKYFTCLLILLLSSLLLADVLYVNINDLAKTAYDVVEGKVIKVEKKWDTDHKFIYTYITVAINNAYKNKVIAKEIIIKEIGGQLDGYTTVAPCQPEYIKDANVLIFLQKDENYYRTYGLNQGKFNIETRNGEKTLTRNINVNKLVILDKNIEKEDIKSNFKYTDIVTIISNNI